MWYVLCQKESWPHADAGSRRIGSIHFLAEWCKKGSSVDRAADESWVQALAGHHCVVALLSLLRLVCLCHQAV